MIQTPIILNHSLRGVYQLTVLDSSGRIKEKTAPFSNLITNAGLDQIGMMTTTGSPYGTPYLINTGFVGTGTTTPAITDTTLTTYLASTPPYGSGPPTSNNIYTAGPPAYWQKTYTYTFAAGTATGIISEVGVGYTPIPTSPLSYTLFSHALVVTSGGAPTTITVLSTDQLILTYTLYDYVSLTDQTGTISISGTSYALTWRPFAVGTPATMNAPVTDNSNGNKTVYTAAYSGTITVVTGTPSGMGPVAASSTSFVSYSSGTYYRQITVTWGVGVANFGATGVNAITVISNFHKFQIGFVPAIPTTSFNSLSLTYDIAWARYP